MALWAQPSEHLELSSASVPGSSFLFLGTREAASEKRDSLSFMAAEQLGNEPAGGISPFLALLLALLLSLCM